MSPLLVSLDRNSDIPMFRQIYSAIRKAVLQGELVAGTRLPASRVLAEDLAVARTTVVLAYEHLESEGYVTGKGSAGTLVADLPLPRKSGRPPIKPKVRPSVDFDLLPVRNAPAPFRLGEPAMDLFPNALWNRIYARCARRNGPTLLGYGDPSGYLPLRRAIADYVTVSRSVRATADQVILVRSAQQAVDLVMRVLSHKGDRVWVEDPGYLNARHLVEFAGSIPVPVPLDKDGLMIEAGVRLAPKARMACVAPSHHFPLGSTLTLARRLALLDWAKQSKAWIVEDDFDSEFRYSGPPIASLQGLDNADRVIYVGTFSKTLFPALRLGYLIAPPSIVDKLRSAKVIMDHQAPTVEQATLTEFIEEGHFTRHVRKMREVYRERQDALLAAAAQELPDLMEVVPVHTGMHVIGWLLARGADDLTISREAWKHGIEARALSRYCIKAALRPALVLGFAALRPQEMLPGMQTLRRVLSGNK